MATSTGRCGDLEERLVPEMIYAIMRLRRVMSYMSYLKCASAFWEKHGLVEYKRFQKVKLFDLRAMKYDTFLCCTTCWATNKKYDEPCLDAEYRFTLKILLGTGFYNFEGSGMDVMSRTNAIFANLFYPNTILAEFGSIPLHQLPNRKPEPFKEFRQQFPRVGKRKMKQQSLCELLPQRKKRCCVCLNKRI